MASRGSERESKGSISAVVACPLLGVLVMRRGAGRRGHASRVLHARVREWGGLGPEGLETYLEHYLGSLAEEWGTRALALLVP